MHDLLALRLRGLFLDALGRNIDIHTRLPYP